MHCPSCGNESSTDQKFCRKCGFNLEPVGKLMTTGMSDTEIRRQQAEREKQAVRRMVSWMMWGMLILLIGLILIVTNKQFQFDRLMNLVGSFLILGGISVATYGVLDTMRGGASGPAKTKSQKIGPSQSQEENETASTTNQLDGRIAIPVSSVTERTTQLIGDETGRR